MAETDGEVRIKVNLDTDEIDEDMQKLEDKLAKQNSALQRQSVIVERLTARYESLYEKAMQSATPNVESEKILSQISEVELKYKELQDLYATSKLEPNIDEAKINQILSDLETLDKKLIDLRKRYQEAQFSPDMQNKLRLLGKDIDLAVAKEERLTNEVRKTEKAMKDLSQQKVSDNIEKTAKSLEWMSEKLKNISGSKGIFESISRPIEGIGKKILRLASSAFVFNVISAGFRKMSEGIRSIISQDNILSNSLAQIRANLVTAFYPIYQSVLPAIRALGQALSWITGQVASFMAMLTGTSVNANQQGAKDMMIKAQGLEKEAKGYQKVGKSAKKASNELASFDKINVLKSENSNIIDPDIKTSKSTGSTILKGFESNLPQLENKLAEMFERLKKPFEDMDLTYLNEQLNRLWETLDKFGNKAGEGLWWLYENVLAPLSRWTISDVLPRFLEILTNLLEAIQPVIDQVSEDLQWLWKEFLEPAAKWIGSKITEFLDKLIDSTKGLGDKIKSNKVLLEFLSGFIIGLSSVAVAAGLWGLAEAIGGVVIATWNWTDALLANPITWIIVGIAALIAIIILCVKHWDEIKEATSKAWEATKQCWEKVGQWFDEKVAKPMVNFWNDIISTWKRSINSVIGIFEGLINKVIFGVNLMTGALSKIGFSLPDWLGGGRFSINIPKIPSVSIPRLSQGAVLEGGNPFLAWLGDQPKGQTNIETPLKTMVEAFNQALRQNKVNEVGNVTIEATGDIGKLVSFLNFKLKQEDQRIGNNFVTGDVWI